MQFLLIQCNLNAKYITGDRICLDFTLNLEVEYDIEKSRQ